MAKVLIVDDEERMLTLYREVVSRAGFEALTANNGEECLRLAAEQAPDLILLDVMMPGKDGGEVAKELSENKITKNIPVIFLTSLVSENEVKRRQGVIGGRLYISKSADKKEFLRTIKEVLGLPQNLWV